LLNQLNKILILFTPIYMFTRIVQDVNTGKDESNFNHE